MRLEGGAKMRRPKWLKIATELTSFLKISLIDNIEFEGHRKSY